MTGPGGTPARLSIGEAAQALSVSIDTLRRWESAGRLTFQRENGRRTIEAAEVARVLRDRRPAGRSSARNRMTGIVLSVKRDGVMAQVELACGPFRIVSLMSREAADDLELQPGTRAHAIVKATTVVVETT